jgi:hypothetical protein
VSKLFIVSAQAVDDVWPMVADGVAEALASTDGEGTPDDAKAALKAGKTALLLMVEDGKAAVGLIVGIYDWPQYRIARVHLLFGNGLHLLDEAIAQAEEWAVTVGCKVVEGWVATKSRARLFGRMGYEPKYEVVRKSL